MSEIKMLITQQIIVTATFSLHHRDQKLTFHKICYFEPFLKFQFSKKFSWGPLFAKMPKMTNFSGLRNRRLRFVRSIVSGANQFSLKCLMRTFISSNFQ